MSWLSREEYHERKRLFGVRRTVRARARLVRSAIPARRRIRGPKYELITAPGLIAVRTAGWRETTNGRGVAGRGCQRGWTAKSKQGLRHALGTIEFPDVDYVFLTLTYGRAFPHDPIRFKADLHAFHMAFEREFGGAMQAVWAQEFQERGAVHFHVVAVAPAGVVVSGGELLEPSTTVPFRTWFATTWHRIATGCTGRHTDADPATGEIACTSEPAHFERHTVAEHCKAATSARDAIKYLERELGKERQKTLPAYLRDPREFKRERIARVRREHARMGDAAGSLADVLVDELAQEPRAEREGAGRWWGVWGFTRTENAQPLTKAEYHQMRRLIRRIGRRVIVPQQIATRERARAIATVRGRPWNATKVQLGRWTRPRHELQGLSAIDPRVHAWSYAKEALALLDLMRGATPNRGSFAAIGARLPLVFGWA